MHRTALRRGDDAAFVEMATGCCIACCLIIIDSFVALIVANSVWMMLFDVLRDQADLFRPFFAFITEFNDLLTIIRFTDLLNALFKAFVREE